MEPSDLLRQVVLVLERLGVPYLVTGSIAAMYYGEPRFTNDIDVVAALSPDQISGLCQAFPHEQFYISEHAVRQAVAQRGQFNIIHPESGLKVDVMVPPDTPFNRSRFSRTRRVQPAPDYQASFASAEDVILKKMEYYREGGSEKHLRDIASMLKLSGDRLDEHYISEWATRLGVEQVWRAVLARVGR
jgi:hypothetical protein